MTRIRRGKILRRILRAAFKGVRRRRKNRIAAYHAGRGQVNAWLRDPDISPDGKTLVNIPESETKKYVEKVQRAVRYMTNYTRRS